MEAVAWKTVCLDAVSAALDLPLSFSSPYTDMKGRSGPCKLVGAVIEPCEDYDEESLPVYLVKLQDGSVIDAVEEELSSCDEDGLVRLIAGVSLTFGVSRVLGDWAGPTHLMKDADEDTKGRFLDLIALSAEEKAEALG